MSRMERDEEEEMKQEQGIFGSLDLHRGVEVAGAINVALVFEDGGYTAIFDGQVVAFRDPRDRAVAALGERLVSYLTPRSPSPSALEEPSPRRDGEDRLGVDYCGYCKGSIRGGVCLCDGRGGTYGSSGVCGYCHADVFGGRCRCNGFGGPQSRADELERESCRLAARARLEQARGDG